MILGASEFWGEWFGDGMSLGTSGLGLVRVWRRVSLRTGEFGTSEFRGV